MRNLPILKATVLLALCATLASGASPAPEDELLNNVFREYLDAWFQLRPLDATRLGDRRFDRQWDDLSAAHRARFPALVESTLRTLPQKVRRDRLSADGRIDYEMFRHELEKILWLEANTSPYEQDPRVYNEYLADGVYLILAQTSLPKETAISNCLARMGQIPSVVAAARATLKNPPRVLVETALRQNQGAISFYEGDLFELAGPTPQLPALRQAARQAADCLKQYQEFLEKDLLPKAQGEWRLGKEKFYRKLELELDAGLTADQVLADAESEFARVERDMYVVARQLWSQYLPGQPLPPDDPTGRTATLRAVLAGIAQEHGPAEELTREVRRIVEDNRRFIRERDILRLPDPDQCQVIEMPEFQRGNSTAYMNSSPPLDPTAPGFYAVSPPPKDWDAAKVRSYLEEYNSHMLKILTIHEAYPGHYVQLEYANRNPSPIRRVLASGSYIEGWAVYTEQTMLDQGYGERSLPLRLTQLKFYLRAVANAILDHRMHCDGMSDEQAMDLLVQRAFQSEGEARLKVIRAKQSSCQLSTYFVGRTALYRLRQQLQRERGERFNLGRYHEAVLAPGAIPPKFLPEWVRQRLSAEDR